ncbi:MAG: response regulator [Spirochaetota bacterium]|nr:response regulator [Spirochaetota bacterium]HPV98869.1 response regulator [Spirochaetota bacterium]
MAQNESTRHIPKPGDTDTPKPPGRTAVLVADDEPAIRDLLVTVLSDLGIGRIDSASNGMEARELCRLNEYDIIFLDVSMPVLSGIEAYHDIREARPDARIVFITGLYKDDELMEKLGGVQACDYLRKPFNITEIRSIVARMVGPETI